MPSATVVYSGGADGAVELQGQLFEGQKFFIAARVPQRSYYVNLVKSNGGEIVQLEKKADFIIGDHVRKGVNPLGALSYRFIEESIKTGKLADAEHHVITSAQQADRPAGTPISSKSTRTPFTKQDDLELWDWMQAAQTSGGSIKGNKIYQQLAEKNQRHTYQSWRDRYLKVLRDKPPAGRSRERVDSTEATFGLEHPPAKRTKDPPNHIQHLHRIALEEGLELTTEEIQQIYDGTERIIEIRSDDTDVYKESWRSWAAAQAVLERGISENDVIGFFERVVQARWEKEHDERNEDNKNSSAAAAVENNARLGTPLAGIKIKTSASGSKDASRQPASDTAQHPTYYPKRKRSESVLSRAEDESPKPSLGTKRPRQASRTNVPAQGISVTSTSNSYLQTDREGPKEENSRKGTVALNDNSGVNPTIESETVPDGSALRVTGRIEAISILPSHRSPHFTVVPMEPSENNHERYVHDEGSPQDDGAELDLDLPLPYPEEYPVHTLEEEDDREEAFALRDRITTLDTQAILNGETQQVDLAISLPGNADVREPLLSHGEADMETPITETEDIEKWQQLRIAAGANANDLSYAIIRTTGDLSMADVVLRSITEGKSLPQHMRGVWTEGDDETLLSSDIRGMRRLHDKHGEGLVEQRREFLEEYMDNGGYPWP